MTDKVSVIVPVYNAEKYLSRCIDSITAQTYTNLEIILIDDGSPDKSGEICDRYTAKDSRIKVFHQENAGVSVARNVGLDIATGEYVTFVDSDDYIDDDYIEVHIKSMVEDVDLVVSVPNRLNPDGTPNYFRPFKKAMITNFYDDRCYYIYNRHYWICSAFYRKAIIDNIRFNTNYYIGEDILFFYVCLRKTRKISFIQYNGYNYIIYSKSSCRGEYDEKLLTAIDSWNDIYNLYKDIPSANRAFKYECARCAVKTLWRMRNSKVDNKLDRKKIYKIMRKNFLYYYTQLGFPKDTFKEKICYALFTIFGDFFWNLAANRI